MGEEAAQLSNLPGSSSRLAAPFTVPTIDKKLWDSREENQRPSLSAYGRFTPSHGAAAGTGVVQNSAAFGQKARQVPGRARRARARLCAFSAGRRGDGRSGLTCEADLDEVQRVQRQGGQDAAAHSRRQVLQPHVPQHGAHRRLPRQRLARRARGTRGAHRRQRARRGGAVAGLALSRENGPRGASGHVSARGAGSGRRDAREGAEPQPR